MTLTVQAAGQTAGGQTTSILIPATYDHATKILHAATQPHVGVITYGLGALGEKEPRTAHSFLPEFEEKLGPSQRLTVAQFSERLGEFFAARWAQVMPGNYAGPEMIFLIGGYDAGEAYSRVFEVSIPKRPKPVERFAQGEFGIIYGGQREIADRIIQGFDDALPHHIQEEFSLDDQQRNDLRNKLRGELGAKFPFAFLPLQDCVNLAIFLIRATIAVQTWSVGGIRGVGGPIDVATVTRTKNFCVIQNKTVSGEKGEPR